MFIHVGMEANRSHNEIAQWNGNIQYFDVKSLPWRRNASPAQKTEDQGNRIFSNLMFSHISLLLCPIRFRLNHFDARCARFHSIQLSQACVAHIPSASKQYAIRFLYFKRAQNPLLFVIFFPFFLLAPVKNPNTPTLRQFKFLRSSPDPR